MSNSVLPSKSPLPPTAQPSCVITRIFLKNSSLALPSGADAFASDSLIDAAFLLNVDSTPIGENQHDISLRVTMTGKIQENVIFVVDVTHSALFQLHNVTPDAFEKIKQAYAPSVLAPYARATLSDLLARATLPLFLLPEIDWASVFATKNLDAATPLITNTTVH